ncbi:type VII secretion-associated serine protease mycosin [Serratia proteamaculans]|uniref:S8 family peptidase n=1 Tax=Serratia proteamaculans TaxID=28151 RepID=UPI002177DF27|nr:S8 family peptidase [Serratia proteamaculans]CAI1695453.1 type VII secretion-associated serine protease mycosin [Serratia proteamaculans]
MKDHIKVSLKQQLFDFSPIPPKIDKKISPVNKNAHFAKVRGALQNAISEAEQASLRLIGQVETIDIPQNIVLTFKENVDINDRLVVKSLDSHGMTLLSVNKVDDRYVANVSVPKNKIEKLKELVDDYGTKIQGKHGAPKNKSLIESISEIDYGDIGALWFCDKALPVDKDTVVNVEIWLNTLSEEIDGIESKLNHAANILGVTVVNGSIKFRDRLVKIVCASVNQLEQMQLFLQRIAEIRPANTISLDFLDLKATEQFVWANTLTHTLADNLIPVCILDTGVTYGHPLLEKFTNSDCVISAEPQWTPLDHKGHGTGIAGLVVFGDLKYTIQSQTINITATIESVKILPDQGVNDPKLYGSITSDAIYNIESIRPSINRIYTMAVTSEYNLRGTPSSWSAKVDELASGTPDDETKRLFVISAGNMEPQYISEYPTSNLTTSVEDPANSYNALTIGYWASEVNIKTPGYVPIATLTDLGPTSTTSLRWLRNSPVKPDVIFEGGNYGFDHSCNFPADLEELSLMTTSNEISTGIYFSKFGETSAATALAANFASKIWSKYPNYWPETIRALVIHSAEWPQGIYDRFAPYRNKQDFENLLRSAGYGYPNIIKAISSGDKSVNLVIEDQLQPYTEDGKLNKMVLYTLPWPSSELAKIGGEDVKLRITLSYFVEPNPGERGWDNKYKYSSCGLRFDINGAGEESNEFVYRINKKFRDENEELDTTGGDSNRWTLGQRLRSRGSVHSDVWNGTAAELADKKYVAIYPVSGWWKELKKEKRQSSVIRFSLIVSIETPSNNIDIHNTIEQMIAIDNVITNTISI